MTPLQLAVWAASFALHMDRLVQAIDPTLASDQREAYMARAATLAAERADDIARHVPGPPQEVCVGCRASMSGMTADLERGCDVATRRLEW